MTPPLQDIRIATEADVPLILKFIKELATYEKLLHEVVSTEDGIREACFGEHPVAYVIIGEREGKAAGFALYYYTFSTFVGRPGIYLEDLYVMPEYRGSGLGKALIMHLADKAYSKGYGRLEWAVLDWNTPSIEFYDSLGATPQEGWTGYRLDRAGLQALCEKQNVTLHPS